MSEVRQIPKLRFNEFSNSWRKVLLNDIATFSKGKSISKSDIIEDGETECIRYGELYTDYKEIIDKVVSKTNLPTKDLVFSNKNDIIIPSSGETQLDIATASCILKDNVALGGDLNIIRTKEDGIFIAYYLNSAKKKKIASLAQGNSVVHLYNHQLKELNLNLPDLKEQQKIASFLTAINKKIELLQQKKILLEKYKKVVMQQLFSKKLRFKDGKGNDYPDWEEKKLGEISDVRDGTHDSPKYIKSGFALITSKNLLKNGKIDFGNVNCISEKDYININKRSNVSIGDILFGMIGTIGNPVLVERDTFAIKNVALIKQKELLLNKFFIHYLKSSLIKKQFHKENAGGTQKFIALGLIRKLNIKVPCQEEQIKIANFLSAIDAKILLVNTQIENIQQFNKGLLQQMFV